MNPRVLRRFVKLMALLTVAAAVFWLGYSWLGSTAPGDYQVRVGDNRLTEKNYDEALEAFNRALKDQPDHRGALTGRALVFMQTGSHDEAFAEFAYLIEFLERTLEPGDVTGLGALAAAYANRGILHDRREEYEQALADYIKAIKTDEEAVDGPGTIHRILYGYKPTNVRERALYIYEQLQLPEAERRLSIPEKDDIQRMYKP
jgi:tetratricopeptide (TPR) repeat protein